MIKLIKFFKPFTIAIIFLIILVVVQTMSDLKLPDLMSGLVNDGLTRVDYSFDKEILQQEMTKGELPEFQEYIAKVLQEQGITDINNMDFNAIGEQMKENFLSNDQKGELNSEAFAMIQKMMELNIIKAIPNPDRDLILRTGGTMILVTLLSGVATIMVSFLASRVAIGTGANIRRTVFIHIEKFARFEMNKFGTASLITRTTNDIVQIQTTIFMIFRMVLGAPITFIGGVIMATRKSTSLAMNLIYIIPVLIIIIAVIARNAMRLFKEQQVKLDKLNNITRENITGARAIRAYNRIEHEENRFDIANKNLVENSLKVNRLMSILMPLLMLIMNITITVILWVGAKQVDLGNIQAGDIIAFIQYSFQILFALMMFAMMFVLLPRAAASAERINEVLETEPSIKEPEKVKETSLKGYLEFKDVTFSYPGAEAPALKDISFKMEPGKTTAVIGGTGSGKSTLIHLIMRFYDVTKGELLIDGIDVRKISTEDLRKRVGYVPQKSLLFSGTIEENIRFGNQEATDEEVRVAAEVSQSMEFISGESSQSNSKLVIDSEGKENDAIEEKESGFKKRISQGGSNVSGGQRQRLSIARALVRKPEIYVFDDSFSALDFKTDAKLREALGSYTKESSMLIIAQRVSTIMNSDQIIVLHNGSVVGIGKHEELLKKCEVYQEIVYSQLSKEELA